MNSVITANNLSPDGTNESVKIEIPRKCPRCDVAYSNKPLTSYFIESEDFFQRNDSSLFSLYFCPHCEKCFMVQYHIFDSSYHGAPHSSTLENVYPVPSHLYKFSNEIKTLSPRFVEIYHQSEVSEHAGLSDLCGIGYRKSLEFLVKDYAIAFNPEHTDDIKRQMLSPCIQSYVDNQRIKTLATASAWIGNDETHYTRKHEEYNLQHLKAFIASIVSFIDSELSYLEAEKLLSTPKQ